jgi:uncharacterized membrane-anchored protein
MIAVVEQIFDRQALADEFHARPPLPVTAPAQIYVFSLFDPPSHDRNQLLNNNHQITQCLAAAIGLDTTTNHGDFTLLQGPSGMVKYEKHTDFSSFVVVLPDKRLENTQNDWFPDELPDYLACAWLKNAPQERPPLTALRFAFLPASTPQPDEIQLRDIFGADDYVGTAVSGGRGLLWTDFRIKSDGFGRILIQDQGMSPRRAGRMIQRLIDVETYRILAMMAWPLARDVAKTIENLEQQVIEMTEAMIQKTTDDEVLLYNLINLASRHEHLIARTSRRFAATAAYRALVERRLSELREDRLEGLQRASVFIERRFGPAMRTIEACAHRQSELTERISRTTQLLRTRVEVTLEAQNQALLQSMDQRTAHQLRLQEAVEGLSMFAISYYLLGIIKYAAEGLAKIGLPLQPSLAPAIALPFVLLILGVRLRHLRQKIIKNQTHL